jgi:hypothetical protein
MALSCTGGLFSFCRLGGSVSSRFDEKFAAELSLRPRIQQAKPTPSQTLLALSTPVVRLTPAGADAHSFP